MSTPNILFIMTDQQSAGAMRGAGNPHLRTPNMDALAAAGVRFAHSYCGSPVCGPSRACLLTGRLPHETGVLHNSQPPDPSMPSLGELFQRAGYDTGWSAAGISRTTARPCGDSSACTAMRWPSGAGWSATEP